MSWNPRYVAFANAHNRTPEEQEQSDETRWPGGRFVGFSLWINQQMLEAWEARDPCVCKDINGIHITSHLAWDAWLIRAGVTRLKDDPA